MANRLGTAAAKSLQSCPTLHGPIDDSPPGSSVPEILQARILDWVAISFSKACMHAKLLQSCPTLCNPMDSAHQAPVSTGFSRQEYWSGLPFPSLGYAYWSSFKTVEFGNFLAVQWLGLHASKVEVAWV